MIARNCRYLDLEAALRDINKKYQGNIIFKSLEPNGGGFNFTLTVKSSKDIGARRSGEGRKIAAACWHAHGDFFASLFSINPSARVFSSFYKRFGGTYQGWITALGGNWIDGNIGSQFMPLMMSEACECNNL